MDIYSLCQENILASCKALVNGVFKMKLSTEAIISMDHLTFTGLKEPQKSPGNNHHLPPERPP